MAGFVEYQLPPSGQSQFKVKLDSCPDKQAILSFEVRVVKATVDSNPVKSPLSELMLNNSSEVS
jgi:hypothetical protein